MYVELLLYSAKGRSTIVIFAVAERPGFRLILASKACDLLKGTEVQCLGEDPSATAGTSGKDEHSFPLWIVYIFIAVVVLAFIVMLFAVKRRLKNQKVRKVPTVFIMKRL